MSERESFEVRFDSDALAEAVSAGAIIEGTVRGLFEHGGSLYAITGGVSGGGLRAYVHACRVELEERFVGTRTTYEARGRELYSADDEQAEELRERYYDGMPVRYQGRAYRLSGRTVVWYGATPVAAPVQTSLF